MDRWKNTQSKYWDGRLQRESTQTTVLSVTEFVAELNRRLAEEGGAQGEVRFVEREIAGHPPVATWQGSERMRPLACRIAGAVTAEFRVAVPFQADPPP